MYVRSSRLIVVALLITLFACAQHSTNTNSSLPTLEPSRVETTIANLPPPPTPSMISGEGVTNMSPLLESNEPPAEVATTTTKTVNVTYVVRRGDTLQLIANRNQTTVQQLVKLNGLRNADRISVGQVLKVGTRVESRTIVTHGGPAEYILPDSEIIYSPAYKNFNVEQISKNAGGYLNDYRETVEGRLLTGPQIVQMISERFSVGPRVLLTVLELRSGWVTQNTLDVIRNPYPMGYKLAGWEGLYRQLFWAAERLNAAYYLYNQDELTTLSLFDGDQIRLAANLNAGTVAVQNLIARSGSWETFNEAITNGDFIETYKWLFGPPKQFALNTIVPPDLKQPAFRLPWADDQTWWFTGGPHNGWAPGSAWAAVDFAPSTAMGTCRASKEWAIAVAPGQVIASDIGRVIVDLDGDGFQGTGWAIMYMHMATQDRVPVGTMVNTGDHIGHPSCEGGVSTGSHLHFARMYNGEWIRADDPRAPLDLNGWVVMSTSAQYDGYAMNGNQRREACSCREEATNGIRAITSLGVTASLDKSDQSPGASSPSETAGNGTNNTVVSPAAQPVDRGGAKPKPKPATATNNSDNKSTLPKTAPNP